MQSRLNPERIYPVVRTVAPHDYDKDADAWMYDEREVLRGERDPTYTDVDVYWLYNDQVERVGLAEHNPANHAEFHVLWMYECPFATFLQEDGWTTTDETLWTRLAPQAYDYCMDRGLNTAEDVRQLCLRGQWRIVTPDCLTGTIKQTYPDPTRILFADEDCVVYTPPAESRIWSQLKME